MSEEQDNAPDPNKWPTMVYDPETGAHKICHTPEEIPDGWVDNLAKCKGGPDYEKGTQRKRSPAKTTGKGKGASAPKHDGKGGSGGNAGGSKQPTKGGANAVTPKAPAKSPLDDLNMSRDDAMDLLEEEGVEFDEDADDATLAGLVKDLED